MKILIAPDKFKGSLTAKQVCEAVSSALLECDPFLEIQCVPMADGGEGTRSLLTDYSKGNTIAATVSDPLFRKIETHYGISEDGKTAFIEMADASGLELLASHERNPLYTTSLGTGELIVDALDRNVTNIILGIGGSATNDAGMGAAEALGIKFFDKEERRLKPVGENLQHIHRINWNEMHSRLSSVTCTILCDVDNPLHGPRGAAYTFACQKGADASGVRILDKGLKHSDTFLQTNNGVQSNFPGAGAAGGFAVLLRCIMKTQLKSGIDFISTFTNLESHILNTDIVITGEGSIDEQTLSGKVVHGIANLAKKYKRPLFALTGTCSLSKNILVQEGILEVVQLVSKSTSKDEAVKNAAHVLKKRVVEELYPLIRNLK